MQKTPTLLFGKVSNSHGYKGEFRISSLIPIQKISEIKFIFIKINGSQIPFRIESFQKIKDFSFLVKIDEFNSDDEVKKIVTNEVFIENKYIANFKENQNIIGFSVIEIEKGFLGKVETINDQTIQKIIFVKSNEKKFCFPYHENFIKNINYKKKELKVKISDDLINLN